VSYQIALHCSFDLKFRTLGLFYIMIKSMTPIVRKKVFAAEMWKKFDEPSAKYPD
jgi:hypothetical protein